MQSQRKGILPVPPWELTKKVCVCVCVRERERERKEWTVNKPNINKELIEVILKNDKRKIDKNGGLTEKKLKNKY